MTQLLRAENISKHFTLHEQGGVRIPVLEGLNFSLEAGECVAIVGASGAGKSTFLRMLYANYQCPAGRIVIRHDEDEIDIAHAHPHTVLEIRRKTLGYVSQFLRVVPRVPTLQIVADPLIAGGTPKDEALARAQSLLQRLNIPENLWTLSPVTFSGGEQQRVNIARGFAHPYAILLLDEPTASLDPDNKAIVLEMISEARERGTAVLGIFHDAAARDTVCTREFDISQFKAIH